MDISEFIINETYGEKDRLKFLPCTKLISKGVNGSSSDSYGKHKLANTGIYNKDDIVGISTNGNRSLSSPPYYTEISTAISAGVTKFIIDKRSDRMRAYNSGERLVADRLEINNFVEVDDSGVFELIVDKNYFNTVESIL